jgi:hypothetical protein
MFRNVGCSNYCSYGELFEMWIVARFRREIFRSVVFSNYCSYGELFEMRIVAKLRRVIFRNNGFSNFTVVTDSCLKCGL